MSGGDRLVFARGLGTGATVFGCVLAVAGVALVVAGSVYDEPMAVVLGTVFTLAGLLAALGRSGVTFDQQSRQLSA
jgi:hypothetical protein